MKYIILRAQCRLSNGSNKVFCYDYVTEQNTCNDVNEYRTALRKTVETSTGITVSSVLLTYEEYRDEKNG